MENLRESKPSSSDSSVQTHLNSTDSDMETHDHDEMDSTMSASASSDSEEGTENDSSEGSSFDGMEQNVNNIVFGTFGQTLSRGDDKIFGNIISNLSENTEPSSQLAALNKLCDVLLFSTQGPLSSTLSSILSPLLVRLVNHGDMPDVMLWAMRAITYIFDVSPTSIDYLVINDVVPALCQKLLVVEYEEVAEQCLNALETLSRGQPIPCLDGGVIMAVLNYIDFFSTRTQRLALSTVMNICRELRSENHLSFMEAVPILCNLLRHEDQQIVENAAACLVKIVQQVDRSSEMLDELCKHGLIEQVTHLLSLNGQRTLQQLVKNGLITSLVKLASGSVIAFRTLHDLNISTILKDMLSTSELLHGMPLSKLDQVYEVLKLLNELLPAMTKDHNDPLMLEKESILANRPELLQKVGKDVLPQLIQMFNVDASLHVCHGSLSVVYKLVYFIESDMLEELLSNASIASFLAGVFTQKDQHALILALQIAELTLQKFSDDFLKSFIKEGVFVAMEALSSPETSLHFHSPALGGIHQTFDSSHRFSSQENHKCLCYAFSSGHSPASSEAGNCKLDKDSIYDLSKHIKEKYITPELYYSENGFSDVLLNLRSLSTALNDLLSMSIDNSTLSLDEEKINSILHQILETLNGKEKVTTFEFIESGIVKSLLDYLSNGQDMEENGGVIGVSGYDVIIEKRFEALVKVSLSGSNPLSSVIRNLQSALTLEDYPVILNDAQGPKLNNSFAIIPNECSIPYPCLRVRFIKDERETCLNSFTDNCLTADPFCPLHTVEEYLWLKVSVRSSIQEQEQQVNAKADPKLERQYSASWSDEAVQKLVFYLDGELLDHNLTLYQEILRHTVRTKQSYSVRNLWRRVHTLTYRRAAESMHMISPEHLCSPQDLSVNDEVATHNQNSPDQKSSSSYDILFLLQSMEGLNRYIPHLMSCERICDFAEGKVDSLDSLKVVVSCVAQNEFLNSKLTERLEQQMSDTLAVSTGALPIWWRHLMDSCPFLFNFETKYKYLKLAAFGQRQNQHHLSYNSSRTSDRQLNLGGLPHMKFVVSRSRILESAAQMMDLHAEKQVVFDVEYDDEAGTGHGPTLEFYTLVCQEFQKYGLGMWREDTSSSTIKTHLQAEEMKIHSLYGLFPRPLSATPETSGGIPVTEVIKKFFLLGHVVAKAIQEGRILDLHLSKAFCKLILQKELSLYDIQSFDPELGKVLQEFQALVNRKKYLESVSGENSMAEHGLSFRGTRIEDLCLDFTLPGYPDFAFGSYNSMVNMSNLEAYVSFVTDATVRSGISRQQEAFISGFNQVFPIEHLQSFSEEELELIFCGEQDNWAFSNLAAHIKFDHGYTASSPPIVSFLEIVQEFDHEQRRAFLQFVTGAPRLPPGGLASLNPMLTIVRKHFDFELGVIRMFIMVDSMRTTELTNVFRVYRKRRHFLRDR
ncbi:hypothetical protein VNO77_17586 [Canavalia gladiata]|uniref:HECT-type E3 ubiquitin transferase n=1 Tax=Canavalia gladiata TaxID=3824 RepID=A0AAN9LP75_CANGL